MRTTKSRRIPYSTKGNKCYENNGNRWWGSDMALSSTLKYASALLLLFCSAAAVVGPDNEAQSSNFGRSRGFPALCPGDCFCSSEAVRCEGWAPGEGAADVLQLPSGTRVLTLEAIAVGHLDATTTLKGLAGLRWLRIHGGELVNLPALPLLPILAYLDVSSNRIQSLPSRAFNNTPHIVKVNLSGNDLRSISSLAFEGLTDLKEMDLSQNPFLAQLPDNLFAGAPTLKFLDLSHTGLVNFTATWAHHLEDLHFLNLSYNAISIPASLHLGALAVLDLSRNPLLHLPPLEGFPHLTKLFVSHSLISYLKVSDTQGCNRLQILDLRHSNLTNLNEHILSHCSNLIEINLSYNFHLWRIEHGAFSGLKNLTILRLDHCPRLYDLEENALNDLQSLRELYLHESGVKVLPSSLSQLDNLTVLNLEGTSLLCDCYAYWLPEILSSHKPLWRGLDLIHCNDGVDRTANEITSHLKELQCAEVVAYTTVNQWVLAPWGQSALLECNVTGNPTPKIIWQTVNQHMHVFNKSMRDHPWVQHQISEVLSIAEAGTDGKFEVLQSGQLLVRNVTRKDIGRYKCFAFNPVSNTSVVTFLGLDDTAFRAFILESILFGLACAALFFLITLLVQFIKFIMDRLGWECCCCKDRLSPKAKQIWQLIESVEAYKTAQLEKLRENYNSQVVNIKDSCYQQMERLRESYAQQSKNLKDLCDYSTQQITGVRDQYLDQVNRIRDYSTGQMNRVRENYVFQRHRIRKFSGHQLLRLRETYKYQQKTLNKLLETLPDLYIQNCRTGSCQRTDSIVFDDEIAGLDAYYKVDFLDSQSYSSDYYTPNSTLTRQSKGGRNSHSRAPSSASGTTEYQEAHSWITRQESLGSDQSTDNQTLHNRSFSITVPPSGGLHHKDSLKGHKRSISASSHPSPQLFHPKPPLLEETGDNSPPFIMSPKTPPPKFNRETPLYTPLVLTPVHDVTKAFASLARDKEPIPLNPEKNWEPDAKKTHGDNSTGELLPPDHAVQNSKSDCNRGDSAEGEKCDSEVESDEPARSKPVSYETSL